MAREGILVEPFYDISGKKDLSDISVAELAAVTGESVMKYKSRIADIKAYTDGSKKPPFDIGTMSI